MSLSKMMGLKKDTDVNDMNYDDINQLALLVAQVNQSDAQKNQLILQAQATKSIEPSS